MYIRQKDKTVHKENVPLNQFEVKFDTLYFKNES